ncbi:MAG: hypothetical protein FWC41_00090 [Firmicutes bacterium]|nr:hypothetical protein [Bacillota bacterium]
MTNNTYDNRDREVRGTREAELVLSPNEYAYVLDKTKGHVTTWVGPTKTSLSNTDSPVIFDTKSFTFVEVSLTNAIQKLIVIPESWYGQFKNPTDSHPKAGNANSAVDLKIGQKVNVRGPASFALYPGQMIRVICGHSLRSNQYLVVRIYDDTKINRETLNIPAVAEDTELAVGRQFIIKGTEMAFFIPPDGVEVVREGENYVRDALTLEQLEYCILLDENGEKRYVKGPAVVFPTVTETFVLNGTSRVYRALELTPTGGIYIKVTEDYEENGISYKTGQELFVTGKEQMIYFPRKEHTIIQYSDKIINYATAVPAGDAKYILNKETGEVYTHVGPAMLLPDPRKEVFANRVLSKKECDLLFPGNREVIEYNSLLESSIDKNNLVSNSMGIENKYQEVSYCFPGHSHCINVDQKFERGKLPHKPHSITINNKFQGAVKFNVWTGYAVQLIKDNNRRVVVGPAQVILDYDETVETLTLSSGKPKTTDNLIETAFLRYSSNKVSDIITAQTSDFINTNIKVSFLVNFKEENSIKWFAVDNYVKLLCDRVRSKVKRMVKSKNIRDFYANGFTLIRREILGEPGSEGMYFDENGMIITDVDILAISIDGNIERQLEDAANKAFKDSLFLEDLKAQAEAKSESLEYQKKITELSIQLEKSKLMEKKASINTDEELEKTHRQRMLAKLEHENCLKAEYLKADLQREEIKQNTEILSKEKETTASIMRQNLINQSQLEQEISKAKTQLDIDINAFELQKAQDEQGLLYKERSEIIDRETLIANATAQTQVLSSINPHLTAELKRVADTTENYKVAKVLAESLAPTAIIGGKSMADILIELSRGTVYENIFGNLEIEIEK